MNTAESILQRYNAVTVSAGGRFTRRQLIWARLFHRAERCGNRPQAVLALKFTNDAAVDAALKLEEGA